ncbi:immunoglobulin-like and fibronectin type III domain-containing protein 1 [Conger conger]|uniref:immunoglobulin-like and fibronectin type III domain-containing protein 1 n=1 Tax=Conger conger TaxID=82655 RepID=UPI002A5A711C|nr:immunoglobulin-like and fibronectin type III domain-containing protein 1 [Conger conger]
MLILAVAIKKKSKVPGVMITQYVEELPEGKSSPDFIRKPIALTIQEGKLAIFKAVVSGDPKPTVIWTRNTGDMSDPEKYQNFYNETDDEYTIQIPSVSPDQEDTYKCFATNEFGRAICTARLNVIKGKKRQHMVLAPKAEDPAKFRKLLKTRAIKSKAEPKKEGEIDPKFWEILLSSEKKDYERICFEFGVTDFRWMLTKLNQIKKEREKEQAEFIENLSKLKHIEIKPNGLAEFEFSMDLKSPHHQVFLYKDGELVPLSSDKDSKHHLKKMGRKYVFSIRDLTQNDAGLYQVLVEDATVFSTDFKIIPVEFIVKIQEVKAKEREDAAFECVLSHPFPKILWMGKNKPLEQGEKFDITVSEDKLTHRLVVKDCMQVDKGIYAAVAGIKSCSAWLIVEADNDPRMRGKKKARKTTCAVGGGSGLVEKVPEQPVRKEPVAVTVAPEPVAVAPEVNTGSGDGGAGERSDLMNGSGLDATEGDGLGGTSNGPLDADMIISPRAHFVSGLEDTTTLKGQSVELVCELSTENFTGTWYKDGKLLSSKDGVTIKKDGAHHKLLISNCQDDHAGKYRLEVDGCKTEAMLTVQAPRAHFVSGLEDTTTLKGQSVELVCELSTENCTGTWYKDGKLLSSKDGVTIKKDGAHHKLLISNCQDDHAGKYRLEVDGRKTEAMLTVQAPRAHFVSGLEDTTTLKGQSVELVCELSTENCTGTWYKDGKLLSSKDGLTIKKDGAHHKLLISNCQNDHAGKYRLEVDGRKTEAMLIVQDPPKLDADALAEFSKPVVVRAGEKATFKMTFVGRDPMKVQWYKDDEEQLDGLNVKREITDQQSRLLLSKCQRKDSGEVKIKIKNEFGTIEAKSRLIVLDKPTPPQGPVDVLENSANCIEFKWRPPKDDGGSPVTNYSLEHQQVGRNTWKKIGIVPKDPPSYRDTDVEHGRRYCYRIRAVTAEGDSQPLETEDIMAGTKAYPGPPAAPKVVSAFKDCINLSWVAPTNTGGTAIVGYNLEKRKKGSNLWSLVNPAGEPIKENKCAVEDVVEGMEYQFRVAAINLSGAGEPSPPSETVIARDPKKPPGKVMDLKVTDSSYTTLCLAWSKPHEEEGVQDEAKGYFVEIRPIESQEWTRCNTNAITMTSYTIKHLKSMAMYWVRVIATNDGGEGEPQELDNYILAMPPPVRPRFTDSKMKTFMVVRVGNSVRVNINFEASPMPDIIWLKDGMSVSQRVTVSNTETGSRLLIPTSEYSDTGIYTIIVKNIVGQETFSIEIRVTDEPKPPGPVELKQNVAGTVTLSWTPSPDEKRDDRLHYTVSKRDPFKRAWEMVADHLFNNKFTVCNIVPGQEYYFRVYAKNDIGLSLPSKSPVWGDKKTREKFTVIIPSSDVCNTEKSPSFLVPLKIREALQGYECYMSCAVQGDPAPHVTWYRDNVSLNTNTNYYITNTCGVCSMLILRVGPHDSGEYKVIAENQLGRAECSTKLTIRE